MAEEACCTCARLLSSISPQYDEKTEKPISQDRRLECCGRLICGNCIQDNPRFATYCPFCQVTSAPSPLPQGLRDPPAYSPPQSPKPQHASPASPNQDLPPSYTSLDSHPPAPEKATSQPFEDVLHFLNPSQDTIQSLSLRYNVPANAIRKTNSLYADNLLSARRTILIPGEFYKGGVSLSPRPLEGEEEELRKAKVRRWMVACKVSEYNLALIYLTQTAYDLDLAISAYKADEKWEKDNPLDQAANNSKGKNKAQQHNQGNKKKRFGIGGGITGQLS
ncbi:MAG: hypothetical protein M1812_002050 [Candelaria pacifica]|nr:MAG: hypothetical protein M1812_002050 [Candelaria pacifica]